MENNKIFGELWILCITGGSGVGKTTVIQRLLEEYPEELYFSVSATTKLPAQGDIDGKSYYFYSLRQFNEMEQKNMFIETNPFATGSRYGTLVSEFKEARRQKKVFVVDCEVNGAINIFSQYKGHTSCIFLDTTEDEAIKRLGNSNTRQREKIPERIKNLKEQKIKAIESDVFKLIFDTTGIKEDIVFSVVKKFFLEDYYTRKGMKIF